MAYHGRVQPVTRNADEHGNTAAEGLERDIETSATHLAPPGRGEIGESKYLRQQLVHESFGCSGCAVPCVCAGDHVVRVERLGDAPVARNLIAQLEPLRDMIISWLLWGRLQRCHLREPFRRQQPALDCERVEQKQSIRTPGHDHVAGNRTQIAITSTGVSARTSYRPRAPPASRTRR